MVPNPSSPGVPKTASPEAEVWVKRFLPMLLSPEGLMNLANWMVPISVTAVEPGEVTVVVPSVPMVTLVASAGIVRGGSMG